MKTFTDDELGALALRASDIVFGYPSDWSIEHDTSPVVAEVFRVLVEQERKVMLTYEQPDKKAKWYFPFGR